MKYISFILSWVLVLIVPRVTNDSVNILGAFGIILMLGILMNFLPDNKNSRTRKIGWGFFYGSLSFAVVAIIVVIFLTNAMRR